MEKPFVLEGELPAVEQTAAAAALLMVDFNRRFWPLYRKMGEMLRAGAVGRPRRRATSCTSTCVPGVRSRPIG